MTQMSPLNRLAWRLLRRIGVRLPDPDTWPQPAQVIRSYRGPQRHRDFRRDAAKLARQGYLAGTPSDSPMVPGLLHQRQPATLTVVYTRTPQA